jgi:hypothetical protein
MQAFVARVVERAVKDVTVPRRLESSFQARRLEGEE